MHQNYAQRIAIKSLHGLLPICIIFNYKYSISKYTSNLGKPSNIPLAIYEKGKKYSYMSMKYYLTFPLCSADAYDLNHQKGGT